MNQVIKETGLYKESVHEALKALERARLILRSRTKKHSQKWMNELTPAGAEIARLKSSIEDFNISYYKLLKSINKNLDFDSQDTIVTKANWSLGFGHGRSPKDTGTVKAKLLARGWKPDEVHLYFEWSLASKDFALASAHTFILVLCAKFIQLLFNENIIMNELAKDILSNIFTNGIEMRLQHGEIQIYKSEVLFKKLFRLIANPGFKKAEEMDVLGMLHRPVTIYMKNYSLSNNHFLNNRFVAGEIKDVTNSIASF